MWLNVRDGFLIQLEKEIKENISMPKIILMAVVLVLAIFFILSNVFTPEESTSNSQNQKENSVSSDTQEQRLTEIQRQTFAKKQAESFVKEYFTYDMNSMNRAPRIKSYSSTTLYEEEKEADLLIRPTAELVSSKYLGIEQEFIQPLNDGFIWTATVLFQERNGKGEASAQKKHVSIVLSPSVQDQQYCFVSEIIQYND